MDVGTHHLIMTITERTMAAREKYEDLLKLSKAESLLFWRKAQILYEFKTSRDYKFVFGDENDDIGRNYYCSRCKKTFFEKETTKKGGKAHCKTCGELLDYTPQSWRWFVDELGIPLSTADYRVKTYAKWVVELQYPVESLLSAQTRKLHIAIPYAIDKQTANEILIQAKILPFEEFFKWLKETYSR